MHFPRSNDITFIPSSFLPISGNDTLEITCTPGPCNGASGARSPSARCIAIFSSIEKGITRNVTYCAEQVPVSGVPAAKSHFRAFVDAFGDAFGTLLQLLAWILALFTVILGLAFIVFLGCMVLEAINSSRCYPKSTQAVDATTTASEPTSGQDNTGNEMVDLPALPLSGEDASRSGAADEGLAEGASRMSDDATQYDESETAHLVSTKETV